MATLSANAGKPEKKSLDDNKLKTLSYRDNALFS